MHSSKDKIKEYRKEWERKNPEYYKEWRKKNPDYHKNWLNAVPGYQKHREEERKKGRAQEKLSLDELKATQRALNVKRRASQKQRTPLWFGEFDAFVWKEAAHLCRLRAYKTDIKWHSDHVIPLSGKLVSGLHVWNNCQVIPASMNVSKNNRYSVE